MKDQLLNFINQASFPCVMAKTVAKAGHVEVVTISDIEKPSSAKIVLKKMYRFIDEFRLHPDKLASFALIIENPNLNLFNHFESAFWKFLKNLNELDKKLFIHDPRVASSPTEDNYSFSLKSEAFFLLALHPQSPRWARRFKYPAIIFNPHVQFEKLREKGVFKKVRDIIRQKDKLLQGFANPMMSDFGQHSEAFQYIGKIYDSDDVLPIFQ